MKKLFTIQHISRFVFTLLATCLISYIIFSNLAPFGLTVNFSSGRDSRDISPLGPKDRIQKIRENGIELYKQTSDLIYFDVNMPFAFDTAQVSIIYKNEYPDQDISLGFKDEDYWHYDSRLIDSPVINSVSWKNVSQNPTLYQRKFVYSSFAEFLKNPEKDAIVGVYSYDPDLLTTASINIPDYQASTSATIIDVPLRGKHTFYAYLKHEPFRLKITKQDLNWYKDPDPVAVSIYKGVDKVYSAVIDDDGITDDSKKSTSSQEVEIRNPGPGLPEDGVYKIVVDASTDTLITKIETNLHKIVFNSPVFPANNKNVYPIVSYTTPTKIFTNSFVIGVKTYHEKSFQKINIGNETIELNSLNSDVIGTTSGELTEITIPKNDVLLKGSLGYFSFSKDQFFSPSEFKIFPVTSSSDLAIIDFLVADYKMPRTEGEWRVATRTFDLTKAVIKDGKLSWLIKAPELKENSRSILIKKIDIQLMKKLNQLL